MSDSPPNHEAPLAVDRDRHGGQARRGALGSAPNHGAPPPADESGPMRCGAFGLPPNRGASPAADLGGGAHRGTEVSLPNHDAPLAVDGDRDGGQARCGALGSPPNHHAPLAVDRDRRPGPPPADESGPTRRGASGSPPNHEAPPAAKAPQSAGERRKRGHIPVAVRRAVWRTYGGACCYQDPYTGVICGSTHLLQIDHIVPWALGGSDDLPNLRLHCAVHNRQRDPRCASYGSASPRPAVGHVAQPGVARTASPTASRPEVLA